MKFRWLSLLLSVAVCAPAFAQTAKRLTVIELFTSQGCSSCPPADAILAGYARTRPDLLPLTFHVTYWNSLGWQDPFSFEGATERQRQYVRSGVSHDAYTPELIVDGRQDVVGSQRGDVEASIASATSKTAVSIPLELSADGTSIDISIGNVRVGESLGRGQIFLVGFDREHRTHVGRGENGGRTLLESNVVRSWVPAGYWDGNSMKIRQSRPAGEQVAVILQADNGEILGASRLKS